MPSEAGLRRVEACKLNASGAGATGARHEAMPIRLVFIGVGALSQPQHPTEPAVARSEIATIKMRRE
jgi:hypothetical protein